MARVSVIMGVYNCKDKETLTRSVKSIINQSYTDWEFLICNDGSTDDTLEKLKELEKLDKRIRVISYSKNRGLSHALNVLLQEASGEYIVRQDDDDISYKDRLEIQIQFMDRNKKYALAGTIADVYDETGLWGVYNVPEFPTKESFFWNSPFIHPTIIIRKKILTSVGGYRESKETRRCEDYDLFMRLYSLGYRGYNIQKKLYCYKIVKNQHKKYRPMKFRVYEAIIRYKGYKAMKMMGCRGMLYVLKPLIIGLIPACIMCKITKSQY